QLTLSDTSLTASEALDWGLITEVTPPGEPDARARAVADRWLTGATAAFGQAKRLLRSGVHRELRAAYDAEARPLAAAAGTGGARARIAAFVARSARR